MRTEILKALRNAEGYVSGQELCERLGVSRTAVWKIVNELKEAGYKIEAINNKGYRIISLPDVLTAEEVKSRLHTKWLGRKVFFYDLIDSTNSCAKRLAENGADHGTVVLANMQGAGKGRRGRGWSTDPGSGVYMTIILRPVLSTVSAPMLTLLAAMAAARTCRDVTGLPVGIKWPNDIVISGKKICGILTEMSAEITCINYVVIGIGINVNTIEFPAEIKDKATSLAKECKTGFKRADIIERVITYFEKDYEAFMKTEDLSFLADEYNGLLLNRGKEVRILKPRNEYEGKALGINNKGELLVEQRDGSVNAVFAGEVSVRGLYDYV